MGRHHAREVIPARRPRKIRDLSAAATAPAPAADPEQGGEYMRRLGQNIGALIQVATFQKKRLIRLANAHAERCARVVELKHELRQAQWEIDTLRKRP